MFKIYVKNFVRSEIIWVFNLRKEEHKAVKAANLVTQYSNVFFYKKFKTTGLIL